MRLRGDRLLFQASSIAEPGDLYLAELGGAERRLTDLNGDLLRRRSLPAVERLAFSGADGTPVEGWFLRPAGVEGPAPTVLYIHGGPHSGFGNVWSSDMQLLCGAGYGVLMVNQRGSTGYGQQFATSLAGHWGEQDYGDLMAGVDDAIARGLADPDRLGVCGISGGGNLTCWIVGQTDRFKAAVPENPVTNFLSFYGVADIGPWFAVAEMGCRPWEDPQAYLRQSPITYAHRCTTPTLLVQGEADLRCPAEQSEQFYAVLKANGCVVEMLRIPNSSHTGTILGAVPARRAQNEALLDWMDRYVMAAQPAVEVASS
jgi:dipeptidyl aminopeptidase/acylaminoacyl peptidase